MMSKCANPQCSSIFRYLHDGKLFQVRATDRVADGAAKRTARDEFFWLCNECCKELTIAFDPITGVRAVPRAETRAFRAAS